MINTITLNPAIDVILFMPEFVRNQTNRTTKIARTMGGKGTHVSMNLSIMNVASRAFGFAYGQTGQEIVEMLRESGVVPHFIQGEGNESRTNYMLVEEHTADSTLVSNKGPQPSMDEYDRFCDLVTKTVEPGDLLALAGDASNFTDPLVYNHLLTTLEDKRLRVILDASGPSFKACVEKRPFLVKPNRDELSQWYGQDLTTQPEYIRAIAKLDALGVEVVALSLGGDGSLVKAKDRLFQVKPPKVKVYNTVGCGDCYLAGLLRGFERNEALEDILRYATAASAACAESPLSVGFDPERALSLMESVTIRCI